MIKKMCVLLLALGLAAGLLAGCQADAGKSQMLSFSQANSVKEMEKLDGKQVTIIGFMATVSPVSGKFMYLMNMPYQSCPFCVPNTTELANTIAVYARSNDEFEFTDRAIQVTGTLEFGDYTDEFGYQYAYRIKDATFKEVDDSNMSPELKLWQQLAATDVIGQVDGAMNYVYFLCNWPSYSANFKDGRDYLYPTDALYYVETEGAQFNYGFRENYFEDMINIIEEVDKTAFAELVTIIRDAQTLADQAYQELKAGNCTQVEEYSGEYNDGRKQFKLTKADELETEMDRIYYAYSDWIASWEL